MLFISGVDIQLSQLHFRGNLGWFSIGAFEITSMKLMKMLARFPAFALAFILSGVCAGGHPLDTWHTRQSPSGSQYLRSVCHGNGLFVAVGVNGIILTSATGETWKPQSSGTIVLLEGVTYNNGLFIAVGEVGTILTSADGTNWTKRASGGTAHLYAVTFGNGLFVATGATSPILTSNDGITWAQQTNNPAFFLIASPMGMALSF
ncbi:MAG: hypothetical protein JWQ71_1730 [Pedosphaera sp.]|nr:hypothetical protein [Pedosphaera sp.]